MHTFDWEDDRPRPLGYEAVRAPENDPMVYIHHNGDYSGDAIVNVPLATYREILKSVAHDGQAGLEHHRVSFKLPAKMLADFGNNATIHEAITALEGLIK